MLICWCLGFECFTNPVSTSQHSSQVSSQCCQIKGTFACFSHPFPSSHPEEWCIEGQSIRMTGGHLLLWAQGHLSPPQISDAELFSKVLLSPTSTFKDKYCCNLSYAEDSKRPPKAPIFGDFLGQGKPRQGGRGREKGRGQGRSYRYAIVLRTVENDPHQHCSWAGGGGFIY